MTKEELKEYNKDYYQAHKEERKALYAVNKAKIKANRKDWYEAFKDKFNNWRKEYNKSDLNSLGKTKNSIRSKSYRILRRMNLQIKGYQIHHCFGYEDASKFIYISKALHVKIHQYLRDNNISANSNHWMAIRDIVNSTNEFTYIKY